ncbi:MAG: hypothetical protein ACD_62C00257G0008 [uncultured bacterium]|nr:MAG: hypothetical protein ACD_62C00257G0008 [uncultured bacterium]
MPRIPQHIIDQLIADTDIVDIISEYVSLTKAGSNYKARCPFHQEKTASFMVSPDKQIFHCFGCGAGGNVVSFLMKHDQSEFIDVIKKLANRLNIKLEFDEKKSTEDDTFELLYKVNAYAHWYFRTQGQQSQKVKTYIQNRGLNPETTALYDLGYAPDGFENLVPFFKTKKIPLSLASQLGLVKKGNRDNLYDFFRDRLMFPIHNVHGKIVGFGGRALQSDQEAKYLNSAESPIYHKNKELYGLYQAKKDIAQKKQAVVVEGYIDVLAAHQLGISNTVAPLGTSLTLDQVKKLKRFAPEIILMFDGDMAGVNAAQKAITTCFSAGIHPKLVILPNNLDPGDYLTNPQPSQSLTKAVAEAIFAMDWLLSTRIKKVTHETGSRAQIIREIAGWLGQIPDAIDQMEYKKKFCQYFDVTPNDIEKFVDITYESDSGVRPDEKAPPLEALLILCYLDDSALFPEGGLVALAKNFEDSRLRDLALHVESFLKNHETFEPAQAILDLPEALATILSKILLFLDDKSGSLDTAGCINKFQAMQKKKRLKEITSQILEAEVTKDTERKIALLKEKQDLLANRQ